jgi:hypothetical protein
VLLGVISLFLLGYFFAGGYVRVNPKTSFAVFLFAAAVIVNEILLMAQGVAAISYNSIPFINESLLIIACTIFTGSLLLFISSAGKKNDAE